MINKSTSSNLFIEDKFGVQDCRCLTPAQAQHQCMW